MLRIAIPNKGTLSAPASQMLRDAGYRQRTDPKDLLCRDEANNVEFFYLRPKDIATYVGSGDLDLGITGRDLLVDSGVPASELLDLNFGRATFRWAAPAGTLQSADEINGRRIATAYPGVVGRYLTDNEIKADVVRLDGAVENAVRLGVADLIADVVETGATLRQAGLVTIGDPIMQSSAILISREAGPSGREEETPAGAAQLLRRLQGVLVARNFVMLAYDVRADLLEQATGLTPGIESPTVSPLHREGWVAVQAMVQRGDAHRIMDELYDLGARAILVTAIANCRL
ncbi:putative ATP phosphoribosyltransferase [Actinoplanes missouriensis 431]|uniref:ATP phosphoribosyltransferase n=1 Tax=Actinoplanes missouriensis (strain ATCC 14538 / DSM 43046 / CBS 188.64 / JCM 3121 / NBRC 102363 / NCIMB 12654 / NRRL B-3342 / UNCC 431) TaxID=512565 RepID=I0HEH1_ACTM4|nr:ATP phosphoribosyltransferase [Actinoplanes missouriensis]BAL91408.1 putative ATP phosphoribosyltransferase [Actinoplanes missouriensis 431]